MTSTQQWLLRIPATVSLYGLSGTLKAMRDAMYTGHGKRAAFLTVSLLLSACGGGGGGTIATPAPTPIEFTTWRTDLAGKMIKADGVGKQAGYSWKGTIRGIDPAVDTAASATYVFDDSGNLGGLIVESTPANSTGTSIGFATNQISALAGYAGNLDSAGNAFFLKARYLPDQAVVSNPKSLGWDFQSFGVWESSAALGVFSVGDASPPSPADAIPGVAGATFMGKVIGSYVSPDGYGFTALSNLKVDVNLAGQSLTFTTSETLVSSDPFKGVKFLAPADLGLPTLELTGILTYDSAMNSFSGPVASTDNRLTGNSTGQFYGPNAQELGGVFFLNAASGPESYRGAYGAQQATAP